MNYIYFKFLPDALAVSNNTVKMNSSYKKITDYGIIFLDFVLMIAFEGQNDMTIYAMLLEIKACSIIGKTGISSSSTEQSVGSTFGMVQNWLASELGQFLWTGRTDLMGIEANHFQKPKQSLQCFSASINSQTSLVLEKSGCQAI